MTHSIGVLNLCFVLDLFSFFGFNLADVLCWLGGN